MGETTQAAQGSTRGARAGLVLGPLLFVLVVALPTPDGLPVAAKNAAAATIWVAVWWITVAIPIPVTSLLPLVLFPLLGVLDSGKTARFYMSNPIFLFMGGFIIALAIERWNLHRRIALRVVWLIGTNPRSIVLGFMVAGALLSMWISNSATALMMLPIGLAMIRTTEGAGRDATDPESKNFASALMLGIAYSTSIGGMVTPVGTPPNIVLRGQMESLFPDSPELAFGPWMISFAPILFILLPIAWLVITRLVCPCGKEEGKRGGRRLIERELRELGPMSGPEMGVLAVFVATALLWIFRSDIVAGPVKIPGWAGLLERLAGGESSVWFKASGVHDATVAIAMALLLFLLPSGRRDERGRRVALMDWATAAKLPWGILLLFGGGFAIGGAFRETGLSDAIGRGFATFGVTSPLLLIVLFCLLLTFLTELTSNTASAQVMLPILGRVATAIGHDPMLLMVPATLSASCAFMLPVATPPNAIVFASGHIEMGKMVKAGIIMNLIGVVVIALVVFLVAVPVLGIDPSGLPAWAR